MSKGVELIAAERERQVTEEGYTVEHDAGHARDLVNAGIEYADATEFVLRGGSVTPGNPYVEDEHLGPVTRWPWAPEFWKPTGDPVRDLTKAGALIAAAIDSLTHDAG
jgi:hypothetical protein